MKARLQTCENCDNFLNTNSVCVLHPVSLYIPSPELVWCCEWCQTVDKDDFTFLEDCSDWPEIKSLDQDEKVCEYCRLYDATEGICRKEHGKNVLIDRPQEHCCSMGLWFYGGEVVYW